MLRRKIFALAVTAAAVGITTVNAHARSVRVDEGEWTVTSTAGGTELLGFDFSILGATATEADIGVNGTVSLNGGGGDAILLNPFFDPAQSASGRTVNIQFAVPNEFFNPVGVDDGFRVSWQVFDVDGALLNEFQLSLFALSNGQFAVEFNYNQITFGSDASEIGFSGPDGSFDLLAELGLTFDQYMGVGDDDFSSNCDEVVSPNAPLACYNYFDGVFDPDPTILPDIANGYFQLIDSNSDTPDAQGRYLWIFGDGANGVPEPSTLILIALGVLGFGLARRRR